MWFICGYCSVSEVGMGMAVAVVVVDRAEKVVVVVR